MKKVESKTPKRDWAYELEGRHFGRCLEQLFTPDRRILVEKLDWPKAGAGRCAITVKQFEKPAPGPQSSKPWPELFAFSVYAVVIPEGNSWDDLEAALAQIEQDGGF